MERYEDILDRPYGGVRRHPRMPLEKRAAQFLPFSPLAGYHDLLDENERETQPRPVPDAEEAAALERALAELLPLGPAHPPVTVTCFRPDPHKEGGEILRLGGRLRQVDPAARCVRLMSGETIPFDQLLRLETN